jgi:hypothetical protein
MQTSRRQQIPAISIRKSAIMNNIQTTTTTTTSTPSPIIQQNDTLSPNVASNINPFDEHLTKSIQEQLNQQPILNRSATAPEPSHEHNQLIPLNSSINLKKSCTIGKYMLFDVLTTSSSSSATSNQNDLMYNIALNLNDKKSYYWKVIIFIPLFSLTLSNQYYLFS